MKPAKKRIESMSKRLAYLTCKTLLKTFRKGKQENSRLNRLDSSYVFLPFPLYVLIQYSLIILLISAILIPWYRIMALEYTSR